MLTITVVRLIVILVIKVEFNWYMGGIIMKKLNELLKQKPLYTLFVIAIVVGMIKVCTNIIQHYPVYEELDSIIYIFGIYFICWIIVKTIHNTYIRFGVATFISFIYLNVQMFFDGSYVNYTSFIVIGVVAVLIAAIMMVVIHVLDRWYENE